MVREAREVGAKKLFPERVAQIVAETEERVVRERHKEDLEQRTLKSAMHTLIKMTRKIRILFLQK